jgi:2-(1,2-epoxy-1,2-dihydrophenyl)acetyl-CoA isomerase
LIPILETIAMTEGFLYQSIAFTKADSVAFLAFNRPASLNAIDVQMANEFLQISHEIANDPSIRAIHISGVGRAFMAGGDVAYFQRDPESIAPAIIEPMHQALAILQSQNAPILASVQGPVAGAGLSICLFADYCLAASDSVFNFAYTKLAVSGDLGVTWSLPRIVGLRKALEIALMSKPLTANEALANGLVNAVIEPEEMQAITNKILSSWSQGPTAAFGNIRRLIRSATEHEFSEHLNHEMKLFEQATSTNDFRGAVDAFLNKSRATFTGK